MNKPPDISRAPRVIARAQLILGSIGALLLMIVFWNFGIPYFAALFDEGRLASQESENQQLLVQLEALRKINQNLEDQIAQLTEREAGIRQMLYRADVPNVSGAVAGDAAPSVDSYTSLYMAIEGTDRKVDRLLSDTRYQLASLQLIERQSETDERFWYDIPVVSPVSGPVTRAFGSSRHLLSDINRFHGGIDIAAPKDEPVRATAAGVVTRTGANYSLGRYVDITHGNGYMTRYGHLSQILVSRKSLVERGHIIGHVGKTGKTDGYHVHYEIHHNGRVLDPSFWVFPEKGF